MLLRISAIFFLICAANVLFGAETPLATEAEKKDLVVLLKTLPTRGEFFAEESVKKAGPFLRVLLAFNETDLGSDNYPILALTRQLSETKEHRDFALKAFERIAHPEVKAFWALFLFNNGEATADIVKYLKASETLAFLRKAMGPRFDEFRKKLKEAK